MPEPFLNLPAADRIEALRVVASASGRPLHILEKDVWVVWTLSALFESPFGKYLVFKGGTSLSKAYKVVRRFSEDIDVTYDIRAIAADLVKDAGEDPLPNTKSQGRKWTDKIRERLPAWLTATTLPYIQKRLEQQHLTAQARAENECVYIEYDARTSGYGYVAPHIKIEFGARSTGEPADVQQVSCDVAEYLPSLSFPTASPRVMRVERTFWEKVTAIHVFCLQGEIKDRLARHWYDVMKLDAAGYSKGALNNREIAQRVVRHKSWFFAAKDSTGTAIDYSAAVNGGLKIVPDGAALQALASDYAKMIEDGLFLEEPEPFNTVVERCRDIEDRANRTGRGGPGGQP